MLALRRVPLIMSLSPRRAYAAARRRGGGPPQAGTFSPTVPQRSHRPDYAPRGSAAQALELDRQRGGVDTADAAAGGASARDFQRGVSIAIVAVGCAGALHLGWRMMSWGAGAQDDSAPAPADGATRRAPLVIKELPPAVRLLLPERHLWLVDEEEGRKRLGVGSMGLVLNGILLALYLYKR